MMNETKPITVLELFSGIGGMHAALNEMGKLFHITRSYEINPTAIDIYNFNFNSKIKVRESNILSLTTDVLDNLSPDLLVMSPPCQPFTRQGLKKDTKDSRCSSLLHLISLLKSVKNVPQKILIENVAGFEVSEAHNMFIEVLKTRNYVFQEFLLTPSQFGIPNSRLRYYLIAKQKCSSFSFETSELIYKTCPVCTCYYPPSNEKMDKNNCSHCGKPVHQKIRNIIHDKFSFINMGMENASQSKPLPLKDIKLSLRSFLEVIDDPSQYLVKKIIFLKYAKVFDIVDASSKGSCCFTKGYAHYVQGTGSVIVNNPDVNVDEIFKAIDNENIDDERYKELLSSLQLRYFTPREILKLMCFPDSFVFPNSCSVKQAYKVLGNSVNVFVVAILLLLLLE